MDRLRMAWSDNGRPSVVVLVVLTLIALSTVILLVVMRGRLYAMEQAGRVATIQIALGHEVSNSALLIGNDPTVGPDLRATTLEMERLHQALRHGDPALGTSDRHSRSVSLQLAAIDPTFTELVTAVRVATSPTAERPAAAVEVLRETAALYIAETSAVLSTIEAESERYDGRLGRLELGAFIAAFVIAIGVFVLAPAIKKRREAERRTMRKGRPDHLTGLTRRAVLADRVADAIERAASRGEYASIITVGLDDLTGVNVRLGRIVGDRVLQETANRITRIVRAADTVARLEDDRFAVLIEGGHRAEDAASVAEKILKALQDPFDVAITALHLSASVGIAVAPLDSVTSHELIDMSETAMLAAKHVAAGTYQYFSPELKALTRGRLELLDGLQAALGSPDQLQLVFQPKVNLNTGTFSGVEALLRWHHPERGLIMPTEFVPYAEETEIILPLGRWVIEEACRQASRWRDAGLGSIPVSVNVSARQFRNGDLVEVIQDAIASARISPHQVEIELTEGTIMEDTARARTTLAALQDLGVTVAIDDFGTGYSSLSYLKQFPIDSLKIDQSFVTDIADESSDAAISTAIISLAHSLELEVVAEGVESPDQLHALEALGCDVVQGFLFARPLTPPTLRQFLSDLPAQASLLLEGSELGRFAAPRRL